MRIRKTVDSTGILLSLILGVGISFYSLVPHLEERKHRLLKEKSEAEKTTRASNSSSEGQTERKTD